MPPPGQHVLASALVTSLPAARQRVEQRSSRLSGSGNAGCPSPRCPGSGPHGRSSAPGRGSGDSRGPRAGRALPCGPARPRLCRALPGPWPAPAPPRPQLYRSMEPHLSFHGRRALVTGAGKGVRATGAGRRGPGGDRAGAGG